MNAPIGRPLPERLLDLAEEMFPLKVMGMRRAYDMELTGEALVFVTYRYGLAVECGASSPSPAGADEVVARVRALFESERAKGNDVLVWRAEPGQRPPRWNGPDPVESGWFRCAFTRRAKLKAVALTAAEIIAAMPRLEGEPDEIARCLDAAIRGHADVLANLVVSELADQLIELPEGTAKAIAAAIAQLGHSLANHTVEVATGAQP